MNTVELINHLGSRWADYMMDASFSIVCSVLLVFVFWRIFHRSLSPQLGYLLFVLAFLQPFLPFRIEVPADVLLPSSHQEQPDLSGVTNPSDTFVGPIGFISAQANQSTLSQCPDTGTSQPANTGPVDSNLTPRSLLMITWLFCVSIGLLRMIWLICRTNHLCHQFAQTSVSSIPVDFEQLRRDSQTRTPVTCLLAPDIASPMVAGIFRPTIFLPTGLVEGLTRQQLKWVLHHELTHVRRRDTLALLFQHFIQVIFFFHPGIWIASRMINRLREYACDDEAMVLSGISRHQSGQGFLSTIEWARGKSGPSISAVSMSSGNNKEVRFRLMRLLENKPSTTPDWAMRSLIVVVVVAAMFLPHVRALETSSSTMPVTESALPTEPTCHVTTN